MTKKIHKYPMTYLERYHKFTFGNWEDIKHSRKCGCIYCGKVFNKEDVDDYTFDGKGVNTYTALCPNCGIDALIPSCVDAPVTDPIFLKEMYEMFFENQEWNISHIPPEEVMNMYDDNWSYKTYKNLVIQFLMYYGSWSSYIDNEEAATARVERWIADVDWGYKNGATPSDVGVEIAFGCG